MKHLFVFVASPLSLAPTVDSFPKQRPAHAPHSNERDGVRIAACDASCARSRSRRRPLRGPVRLRVRMLATRSQFARVHQRVSIQTASSRFRSVLRRNDCTDQKCVCVCQQRPRAPPPNQRFGRVRRAAREPLAFPCPSRCPDVSFVRTRPQALQRASRRFTDSRSNRCIGGNHPAPAPRLLASLCIGSGRNSPIHAPLASVLLSIASFRFVFASFMSTQPRPHLKF